MHGGTETVVRPLPCARRVRTASESERGAANVSQGRPLGRSPYGFDVRWALLSLAACVPELGDAVVIQGRHVTVHAAPTVPVCEEAVAIADRFVEDLAESLGVRPPAIAYYLFDGETGCGTNQYAMSSCEINGDVYANAWIHFHELAHAVDTTHPPALFVEGFAEAMSWPASVARAQTPPPADVPLPLESIEFRAGELHRNYRLGGAFVRYLLERFGIPRYRTFARSLVSLADRLTIERAFARVYGVPLDEVVASWRAADPAASSLRLPIDLVECGDPIEPIGPDTWGMAQLPPSTCKSGQTARGTVYSQPVHRYGFEVREPGVFVIELSSSTSSGGALWSCVNSTRTTFTTMPYPAPYTLRLLPAGRHALELFDGIDGWRVSRIGGLAMACATAPAFEAPPGPWRLDLHGPRNMWVRIDGSRARRLFLSPRTPVRVCTGGCGPHDCQTVTDYTILEDTTGGPIFIELRGEDPTGPSAVVGSADHG